MNSADCLRTLETLRHLRYPAGADPRIDMEEASAWINHDLAKAHAAAERAVVKGKAQGSHLLVARAYGILCQQGADGGTSSTEAISACEYARESFAAAGDRNNEARTSNDLAGIYFEQGDLARAEAMWRGAIPKFREVGDTEGLAAASNNLGDVFLLQGNLDEAKRSLELSIPDYQAIEDKDGIARALNDLGDVSRQKGDLEAALTTYQQARATADEINDKSVIAYVLDGRGDVLADQGDLAAARKSYLESLALRKQAGEKQTAAETEIALARLSIEEGNAAGAETAMRECSRQFRKEQEADDELAAITVLIQALCSEGKSRRRKQRSRRRSHWRRNARTIGSASNSRWQRRGRRSRRGSPNPRSGDWSRSFRMRARTNSWVSSSRLAWHWRSCRRRAARPRRRASNSIPSRRRRARRASASSRARPPRRAADWRPPPGRLPGHRCAIARLCDGCLRSGRRASAPEA